MSAIVVKRPAKRRRYYQASCRKCQPHWLGHVGNLADARAERDQHNAEHHA